MRKQIFRSIDKPCTYGWDNMEGTDSVRFCKQCKLNVYNISTMTEEEAVTLFAVSGDSACVRMQQRADGSVYTDNCPYRLRRLRNTLQRFAPILLVLFAWAFNQSVADAQSLVGAPVDPRYGASNEVGMFTDYGYDTARDCSRVITLLSAVAGFWIGVWRLARTRPIAVRLMLERDVSFQCIRSFVSRRYWQALMIILLVPPAIHLIGTVAINSNFGGLGRGL